MAAALERVCIIGSGNWGTAIARIVGANGACRAGAVGQPCPARCARSMVCTRQRRAVVSWCVPSVMVALRRAPCRQCAAAVAGGQGRGRAVMRAGCWIRRRCAITIVPCLPSPWSLPCARCVVTRDSCVCVCMVDGPRVVCVRVCVMCAPRECPVHPSLTSSVPVAGAATTNTTTTVTTPTTATTPRLAPVTLPSAPAWTHPAARLANVDTTVQVRWHRRTADELPPRAHTRARRVSCAVPSDVGVRGDVQGQEADGDHQREAREREVPAWRQHPRQRGRQPGPGGRRHRRLAAGLRAAAPGEHVGMASGSHVHRRWRHMVVCDDWLL